MHYFKLCFVPGSSSSPCPVIDRLYGVSERGVFPGIFDFSMVPPTEPEPTVPSSVTESRPPLIRQSSACITYQHHLSSSKYRNVVDPPKRKLPYSIKSNGNGGWHNKTLFYHLDCCSGYDYHHHFILLTAKFLAFL